MEELVYAPQFDSDAINAFTSAAGGDLADVSVNVAGRRYPFAVALLGQTLYYSVSPKTILALMEYQADLVTQPNMPDERYRWAVGYMGEGGRFAGFTAQIRWAVREMFYARRDLPNRPALTYADGVVSDAPAYLLNMCWHACWPPRLRRAGWMWHCGNIKTSTNGCLGHCQPSLPACLHRQSCCTIRSVKSNR
jgi:hypothetical protein